MPFFDSQLFSLPSQRNFPFSFKPKVAIAKFIEKMQKSLVLEKWVGRHASFPPRRSVNWILQGVLHLSFTFILYLFGTIYHVIIFSGICCFLLNKRTSPHFICHNWAKTICYWFWITFIKAECTSKPINYSMFLVLLKSSVWNVVSLSPKKLEKSQKTHGLRGASSHRSQTKEFYRWEDMFFQLNFPSFCSLILNT